ncbi:MAG: stage II sporulation protein P [Syntrophomonadaceae bacterium]|jgi:stage II sporulation protein P|nr:stage II sporulation protein P [Syntrophomonadaceae bacterium]
MNRLIISVLAIMLYLSALPGAALAVESERTDGSYFQLVDEKGQVIHRTALMVNTGDEYITPTNQRFKVIRLQGDTAYCRYAGQEKMPQAGAAAANLETSGPGEVPAAAPGRPTVAIYHTHTDESYVPSDGTESKRGDGGIFDVGETLKNKLQAMGINAIHDTTPHDPHDPNAYYRSRRTAAKLLKQGPVLLVDVHRDSVPPEVYATNVEGTEATKVKLVVGRQNSNMSTNLELAKRLKAHMDEVSPGLSGGIFMGKGNYNQDLTPRSILVEVGADTNSKTDAERGISLFAQSLPPVLGIETGPAQKPLTNRATEQRTDWTTALWVVLAVGAGFAGYVYLNRRQNR